MLAVEANARRRTALMTECIQESFAFAAHFPRPVVAQFDGARMTTDGGALLLRQADRKIGLLRRAAACFRDGRDPRRHAYPWKQLFAVACAAFALLRTAFHGKKP